MSHNVWNGLLRGNRIFLKNARCVAALSVRQLSHKVLARSVVSAETASISRLRFANQVKFSSTAAPAESNTDIPEYHNIVKDDEKAKGPADKLEFQAETRMLLDIVARSLYSDKEVFLRELISNASDALEKFRYVTVSGAEMADNLQALDRALEIHIVTDKQNRTVTIQDTGIGMTREELISNLGTIAKSGSKSFIEQLKNTNATDSSSIIGQFGVGFYSAFMVADKVDVYTRSSKPDAVGYKWTSDGTGMFEIQEADGVQLGTKIVIHLKTESREFSDEDRVKDIIKKYSNFVGSPIFVNGQKANSIQPLWLMDPKQVTPDQHYEFYRYVSNAYDKPRFILHYKIDAPLNIRALLYIPEGKPGLFEMSRDADMGVSLYTRKVLIKTKVENILPKWLRFVKGVVDSEDIPLNLSREILQNSLLIGKLRNILTARIIKFMQDQAAKNEVEFDKWYRDYGLFLKEGIVTNENQMEKEEISKLLRFESSSMESGKKVSIADYVSRMKEGQNDIYYLAAPSRQLAESSPYYESLKKRNAEVLFCYEPYDELVLMQLRMFNNRPLMSVEMEMSKSPAQEDDNSIIGSLESLQKNEIDEFIPWLKNILTGKIYGVKVTNKLDAHPCIVMVEEMAAARHFIRTQSHQIPEENRYNLLQPNLEINAKHPLIRKLFKLSKENEDLARLVAHQLFSNSMVAAGLSEDPRTLLVNMNELLVKALEKH